LTDYLAANGFVRVDSEVRAEISFNGKARALVWSSTKLCRAIDDYLAYRLVARHGVTATSAAYRAGPARAAIRASDGEPFTFSGA